VTRVGARGDAAVATAVTHAVTALFVPGNRPERFGKALKAGADLVIVDLEDSVEVGGRAAATRTTVAAFDDEGFDVVVRVSGGGIDDSEQLQALLDANAHGSGTLLGILVPKAESVDGIAALIRKLPDGVACIPLIESAAGVLAAEGIARLAGVTRLAFGAVDFALDIGADADGGGAVLDFARATLVVASRGAGIAPPLDSPSLEIANTDAVARAGRSARALGFGGKLCIHPVQVPVVASAFAPSTEQLDWARRVVSAEGDAVQIDGMMIDRPVVDRARRLLRGAGEKH